MLASYQNPCSLYEIALGIFKLLSDTNSINFTSGVCNFYFMKHGLDPEKIRKKKSCEMLQSM